MATDPRTSPDEIFSVLLKPGRSVYGQFIRDALIDAGLTDMPGNGGYVLGFLEPDGASLSDVIAELRLSKQTISQLIDTLVIRGYIDRTVDPFDRRRVVLRLTERGSAASDIIYRTAREIDDRLLAIVGAEHLLHTKETLVALLALRAAVPDNAIS